jgi:MFS family permease
MGIGNGCLFCPALAVLSTYFSKHRALAIGVAACGSATGGLVYPSMVRQLLPTTGFPWTVRAIGFIQLASLVVSNAFLRTRIPPRKTGQLVEWAAFKEMDYTFYAIGSFFVSALNSVLSSLRSLTRLAVLLGCLLRLLLPRLVQQNRADPPALLHRLLKPPPAPQWHRRLRPAGPKLHR